MKEGQVMGANRKRLRERLAISSNNPSTIVIAGAPKQSRVHTY
jgi:hypothetical protein